MNGRRKPVREGPQQLLSAREQQRRHLGRDITPNAAKVTNCAATPSNGRYGLRLSVVTKKGSESQSLPSSRTHILMNQARPCLRYLQDHSTRTLHYQAHTARQTQLDLKMSTRAAAVVFIMVRRVFKFIASSSAPVQFKPRESVSESPATALAHSCTVAGGQSCGVGVGPCTGNETPRRTSNRLHHQYRETTRTAPTELHCAVAMANAVIAPGAPSNTPAKPLLASSSAPHMGSVAAASKGTPATRVAQALTLSAVQDATSACAHRVRQAADTTPCICREAW
jgi:hypothetical protein